MRLKGLFMFACTLETSGSCATLSQRPTWGFSINKEQTLPSDLVTIGLVQWNKVNMGYSSQLWIILWIRWPVCSQTNPTLWSLICNRFMHNEWSREKGDFGGNLSPSTSTQLVSAFLCQQAAAGFCMLPMSLLQESMHLFLSLIGSITFFLDLQHSLQFC